MFGHELHRGPHVGGTHLGGPILEDPISEDNLSEGLILRISLPALAPGDPDIQEVLILFTTFTSG